MKRKSKRKAPVEEREPVEQQGLVEAVFSISPIFDNIFSHLQPGDAIRLSRTRKLAQYAHKIFSVRAYDIDKLLNRYFTNPEGFRHLQAATNTLISGSAALQFFERTFYPGSDLDLYTPRHHVRQVGEWILADGYTFKPRDDKPRSQFIPATQPHEDDDIDDERFDEEDPRYRISSIYSVYEFRKGDSVVQVMAARHCPFHSVASFHSTCVMNFISYETAVSLYPAATFDARVAVTSGTTPRDEDMAALAKYAARGWTMWNNIPWDGHGNDALKKMFRIDQLRWVNDSACLRIPLKKLQSSVPPRLLSPKSPPITSDLALVNSWIFAGWNRGIKVDSEDVIFSQTELKYRYMSGDDMLTSEVEGFLWGKRSGYRSDYNSRMKKQDEIWWDGAIKGIIKAFLKEWEEEERAENGDWEPSSEEDEDDDDSEEESGASEMEC